MRISDWSSDVCSSDLRAQKDLQHGEIAQLHLAKDDTRFKHARLFQGEAEDQPHGQTDQDGGDHTHDSHPCTRRISIAVAMPPANIAATALTELMPSPAIPHRPSTRGPTSAARATNQTGNTAHQSQRH